MRYKIIANRVVESLSIDAPYDTKEQAERDLDSGIMHNCTRCTLGICSTRDALQQHNAKRSRQGKLIGE